jgi:hypothetical protein
VIPCDDFTSVAAGATTSVSPSITVGPFPFTWEALGCSFASGSGTDIGIKIRDEGASMDFTRDKVRLMSLLNAEDYKYYLAVPWTFEKQSTIFIEIINNDSSAATFYLTFIGFLILPAYQEV